MTLWKISGAGFLLAGLAVAQSSRSEVPMPAEPLESPDEAECFQWKYPKSKDCGKLSGKEECKAQPSIEASDDEDQKEKCKPTKGDSCTCE